MPLYEYRCQKCGKRFEVLRGMQDADRFLECPECQSEQVKRLVSTFAAGGCPPSRSGRFT
jgi:putative FmdB family regulatory protein